MFMALYKILVNMICATWEYIYLLGDTNCNLQNIIHCDLIEHKNKVKCFA